METIRSLMSVRWIRRTSMLVVFLTVALFIATSCNDDDCFFSTIDFTPVEDESECLADCEANLCDECDFNAPDECTGFDCEICVIIDDDDIL
ncbi:MAG: hypothetical protein L0Y68_08105 [Candidatus Dadabacteria bacterium]|nr:hypothetical protein [Candidatus Dadabacteria bacterium]